MLIHIVASIAQKFQTVFQCRIVEEQMFLINFGTKKHKVCYTFKKVTYLCNAIERAGTLTANIIDCTIKKERL